MAANPSLYSDTFAQARSPSAAFTAVSSRLSVERALTSDLAALLRERALVEETYIRALEKLGARLHGQGKDTVFRESAQLALAARDQDRTLGQSWAALRRSIEQDLAETARVHDRWRTKIEQDVAAPLRESLQRGDWARWNTAEQQIAGSVREYESLVDKVQKAQAKSTRSGKSASSKQLQSQSALASLGSSLTSAVPAFLSQSQALDLAHGAFLKECLVRCGTHTSDLGRDRMEAGERLLNLVLAVDEGAEAEEWALREGIRLGGGGGARNGATLGTVGEFGETASSAGREESLLDRDDAASTISGATGVSRSRTMSRPPAAAPPPAAPLPLPTPNDDSRSERAGKSKLGSKFSSILGGGGSSSSSSSKRDRSSSIPNSAKYTSFTPQEAPPLPSPSMQAPAMERRPTDSSSLSGVGGDLLGGRVGAGSGSLAPPLLPAAKEKEKRKSLMPGGSLFRRPSRATTLDDAPGGAQYAQGLVDEPREATGRVDEEGYSLPPEGYDRAIGAAGGAHEGERQASRNLMDEDDEDDMPLASSVPKLSIAPSLPPSSPTLPQEDESARLAALESVKSALGAPASGLGRRATTNRGRRGEATARNTLYAPGPERQDSAMSGLSAASEDDTPLAQVAEKHRRPPPPPPSIAGRAAASPPPPAESPFAAASSLPSSPLAGGAFTPTPPAGRAMSVLSATSTLGPSSSAPAGAARADPFAGSTTLGLRASVTESVSALLKGEEVARALVTGEVALSHRASSGAGDAPVRLRFTGLEAAEKVAPNGAFLHSTSTSTSFSLAPGFAASTGGTTTPVLKYALSSGASSVVPPITLKPTWRVEPGLARAIVSYAPRAGSPLLLSAPGGGALEEVRIELHLAQGTVTSFQAKPPATLLPSGRGIVFALGDVAAEGKLLASLSTEGAAPAQPGNVGVSWVVRGATAGAVGVELEGEGAGGEEERVEVRRETVSGKYLAT